MAPYATLGRNTKLILRKASAFPALKPAQMIRRSLALGSRGRRTTTSFRCG